jgi:hypothetical protein
MIGARQIDQVVSKAASATLKKVGVSRVFSVPATDSEGNEALHVTIVLKKTKNAEISGDLALDTIVGIERGLREAGEERLPIVEFVGEEELESSGDTES